MSPPGRLYAVVSNSVGPVVITGAGDGIDSFIIHTVEQDICRFVNEVISVKK